VGLVLGGTPSFFRGALEDAEAAGTAEGAEDADGSGSATVTAEGAGVAGRFSEGLSGAIEGEAAAGAGSLGDQSHRPPASPSRTKTAGRAQR
jgi:hypothetical protein